jgi:DNA ligase-1
LLDSEATHTDEELPTQSRLKPLPSTYEPDLRTSAWLKLKKDYMEGIGDSLDLIPVGAWHGNGRKAQWWSPVLLALWNPDAGRPVAVCKCMSGAVILKCFVFISHITIRLHRCFL